MLIFHSFFCTYREPAKTGPAASTTESLLGRSRVRMWRSTPQHSFFLRGIFWNIIQRKKNESPKVFFNFSMKQKVRSKMFGQFTFSFLWSKGTIDHALCCIFESFSLAMDFLSLPMTHQCYPLRLDGLNIDEFGERPQFANFQ